MSAMPTSTTKPASDIAARSSSAISEAFRSISAAARTRLDRREDAEARALAFIFKVLLIASAMLLLLALQAGQLRRVAPAPPQPARHAKVPRFPLAPLPSQRGRDERTPSGPQAKPTSVPAAGAAAVAHVAVEPRVVPLVEGGAHRAVRVRARAPTTRHCPSGATSATATSRPPGSPRSPSPRSSASTSERGLPASDKTSPAPPAPTSYTACRRGPLPFVRSTLFDVLCNKATLPDLSKGAVGEGEARGVAATHTPHSAQRPRGTAASTPAPPSSAHDAQRPPPQSGQRRSLTGRWAKHSQQRSHGWRRGPAQLNGSAVATIGTPAAHTSHFSPSRAPSALTPRRAASSPPDSKASTAASAAAAAPPASAAARGASSSAAPPPPRRRAPHPRAP